MNDPFLDLIQITDKLTELDSYTIDLLLEDSDKTITISSGNVNYDISLSDILYLIDNGSLSFPGFQIIETLSNTINIWLTTRLDIIIDKIISGMDVNIELELKALENFINSNIENVYDKNINKSIFTANISDITGEIDPDLLKYRFYCKIYKKII